MDVFLSRVWKWWMASLVLMMSFSGQAGEFKLILKGQVREEICTVESIKVSFEKQAAFAINNSGAPITRDFEFKVNGCPQQPRNQIKIQFVGMADPEDTTLFRNQGTAKNLAIQIKDRVTNAVVKPNDKPIIALDRNQNRNGTGKFQALLTKRKGASVSQGSIDATITLIVIYS